MTATCLLESLKSCSSPKPRKTLTLIALEFAE